MIRAQNWSKLENDTHASFLSDQGSCSAPMHYKVVGCLVVSDRNFVIVI